MIRQKQDKDHSKLVFETDKIIKASRSCAGRASCAGSVLVRLAAVPDFLNCIRNRLVTENELCGFEQNKIDFHMNRLQTDSSKSHKGPALQAGSMHA